MKKHLAALLFTAAFFPVVVHAEISGGQLTAEDDATYQHYCATVLNGTDDQCACVAKDVIGKMGVEKVSLALSGQRMMTMDNQDEAERMNDAAIAKAGSEDALMKIDDDFSVANDEAVATCTGN